MIMRSISDSISRAFRGADWACDYIPVVSTLSNGVDIMVKALALELICKSTKGRRYVESSPYLNRLKLKSYSTCFVRMIPVVNTLSAAIGDIKLGGAKKKLDQSIKDIDEGKAKNIYGAIENIDKFKSTGFDTADYVARTILNGKRDTVEKRVKVFGSEYSDVRKGETLYPVASKIQALTPDLWNKVNDDMLDG